MSKTRRCRGESKRLLEPQINLLESQIKPALVNRSAPSAMMASNLLGCGLSAAAYRYSLEFAGLRITLLRFGHALTVE